MTPFPVKEPGAYRLENGIKLTVISRMGDEWLGFVCEEGDQFAAEVFGAKVRYMCYGDEVVKTTVIGPWQEPITMRQIKEFVGEVRRRLGDVSLHDPQELMFNCNYLRHQSIEIANRIEHQKAIKE